MQAAQGQQEGRLPRRADAPEAGAGRAHRAWLLAALLRSPGCPGLKARPPAHPPPPQQPQAPPPPVLVPLDLLQQAGHPGRVVDGLRPEGAAHLEARPRLRALLWHRGARACGNRGAAGREWVAWATLQALLKSRPSRRALPAAPGAAACKHLILGSLRGAPCNPTASPGSNPCQAHA